jgi:hypothetical protein
MNVVRLPRVVIDANLIVERDWFLAGGAAAALLAASRRGRVRMVVPEVVVLEAVAAHATQERRAAREFRKAIARLHKLRTPLRYEPERHDTEPFMRRTYESWLRERLDQHRVEVASVPEVSEQLVRRAIQRRRPFDAEGKTGFRDALIWETVLAEASEYALTVFATNDGDFGKGDTLHVDLLADLVARNIDEGAIRRVISLGDAVRIALEPASEVIENVREKLADPEWSDPVFRALSESVSRLWTIEDEVSRVSERVLVEDAFAPVAILDEELEDLDLTGCASIVDAYASDEDTVFVVQLRVPAEAAYRIRFTAGSLDYTGYVPEDVDIGPGDYAEVTRVLEVCALFDARYDTRDGTLRDVVLFGVADRAAA